MYKIRVPATTANMGPGFDCIGMAFQMYNELTIQESDRLVISSNRNDVPLNSENLIYKTIKSFYAELGRTVPGLQIVQTDRIPIARGLGSSAACIVAGLLAANEISGCGLSVDDPAQMACRMEGHPDNVAPAIYGGIVVGAMTTDQNGTGFKASFVKIIPPNELSFVAFIPDFKLLTERARGILPNNYTRADAVFNTSRASLFMASIMTANWDNLRVSVDDRFHQPYRKKLIPDMDYIFNEAYCQGAKGVFLSGAGPVIIAMLANLDISEFIDNMQKKLKICKARWDIINLAPDTNGAKIWE